MQQSKPYSLEKFAEGRYDVLAENGMRAGSIIGGHDRFAAEVGNRMIGKYTSTGKAAEAVLEFAGITGIFEQLSAIIKSSPLVNEAHRRDLMMFDRPQLQAWKCATNSLWVIHRAGTSLIHLDLPTSRRQALAVLDAFTPGNQDSGWEVYLIDVNTLKVKRLTEGQARKHVNDPVLYQIADNTVRYGGADIATIEMVPATPAASGKCKLSIQCHTEPGERRITALCEVARQYFNLNNGDKYVGIDAITLRHGRSRRCLWRPAKTHH